MILDKVFSGILDQGAGGCLEVFEEIGSDVRSNLIHLCLTTLSRKLMRRPLKPSKTWKRLSNLCIKKLAS